MNWRLLAACRGQDPSMFFPVRGDSTTRRAAQAFCAVCPVRKLCLEAHLDEIEGFWGGTSPKQRRRIRLERNVVARAEHKDPALEYAAEDSLEYAS